MTTSNDGTRALSHLEAVYRPGDRELVKSLFDALGLQVVEMGKYIAGLIDTPPSGNPVENALFASEITPEHLIFEDALDKALSQPELTDAGSSYLRALKSEPQCRPHLGIAFSSMEKWEQSVALIQAKTEDAASPLHGRAELTSKFRPGTPGAQTDFLHHAFVYTDLIGTTGLSLGMIIELQHYASNPSAQAA